MTAIHPVDVLLFGAQGYSAYTLISTIVNNEKMNNTLFATHPKAAILGFSSMLTGGWLIAARNRIRAPKTFLLHQISMGTGTALAYYAFYIIWTNKNNFKKPHIQTPHSYFGITTLALLGALNIFTLKLWYFPATIDRTASDAEVEQHQQATAKNWWLHKTIAKVALSAMTAAVVTGTMSTFGKTSSTTMKIAGGAVAGLAALLATVFIAKRK